MNPEVYVSTDVEADGKIPAVSSMLSFGSAAYQADKTLVGTFEANLETLPGAAGDDETMAWWAERPEAYAATRTDLQAPVDAMRRYVEWVATLQGRPVFVGYPVAYDFMWMHFYLIRFAGRSPFAHSGVDIKTFAMAVLKLPYRGVSKHTMPRHWFDPTLRHTHRALDDAKEQGVLFVNMLAEHTGRRR